MRPAALIFDVDGTLAETEEVHRQAFNEAFAAAGLDWSWGVDLYRRLLAVTGGKERLRHFIESRGLPALADDAVAALHADKTQRYVRLIADATLRPGIARIIGAAREAGIPIAIATTTSLPNIESLLDTTLGKGAIAWFAAVGAGDMVAAKKPAPDVYELVLRELGVAADACVAFEDSANGLRSARAAGVPTAVTVSMFTDDQDFRGALSVLDHLGEPDDPCTVLAGAGLERPCVTLSDLRGWLGAR